MESGGTDRLNEAEVTVTSESKQPIEVHTPI
jgi:hypothetical protein